MQSTKKLLIERCHEVLQNRINIARTRINDIQSAANEESKSSAGDKYETGRAMMQLERDKAVSQLSEILKQKRALDQIIIQKTTGSIQIGSVALTDGGNFLIGVALGEIDHDGTKYYSISPVSPIGKELLNKKAKESIVVNNRSLKILKVY